MLLTIVIIGLLSGLLFGSFIYISISRQMGSTVREVVNVRFDLQKNKQN